MTTRITIDRAATDQLIKPFNKLPCFCALARIANAMFLLGDHIVWLHRNNLVQMKDIKEWERFSNKSWLYSIILNLITDYRAIKAASSLPLASASSSSSGLNSDPESENLFQKTVCNLLEKIYGKTGCGVFKRGYKVTKRILLNFENWCSGKLSKIGHH